MGEFFEEKFAHHVMLGIELREHFKKHKVYGPKLSPASQFVFIYLLLPDSNSDLSAAEVAQELKYSPMTITRAFDEIEQAKLAVSYRIGRKRHLRFEDKKSAVWKNAQNFLSSPVQGHHFVQPSSKDIRGVLGGLSALSQYSMLAESTNKIIALSQARWRSLKGSGKLIEVPASALEALHIDVWVYDPTILSKNGLVDPLSLYLSLKDVEDERTQIALEKMIENIEWFRD